MDIEIYRIKCNFANCYVLQGNDGAVLVDAGNPGDESLIIKGLETIGVKSEDLKLLVITHGHLDHFGSADKLRQALDMPTAMHTADSRPMPSIKSRGVLGRIIMAFSRSSIYKQGIFQPDVKLDDGLRLDDYGIPAVVLHLPGHSAGSVGILLDDGRLICGDMYMNFLRPSLAHIFENYDLLKNSHRQLCDMDISKVYPGHGKPFIPFK